MGILSNLNPAWYVGIIGGISAFIYHFIAINKAKTKGEAKVLNKITKMNLDELEKDTAKREEIREKLGDAVETLNGVNWDVIRRVRREKGIMNLTEVVKFIKENQ